MARNRKKTPLPSRLNPAALQDGLDPLENAPERGAKLIMSGALCVGLFAINYLAWRSRVAPRYDNILIIVMVLCALYGVLAVSFGLFLYRANKK